MRLSRLGLAWITQAYVLALGTYFALLALGELNSGWPAFLREMTLYLFLPLPALLVAGLIFGARRAVVTALIPVALFGLLYGPQLIPHAIAEASGARIRVMTFNAGANEGGGQVEPLLRLIRAERAQVVALQEIPAPTDASLREALQTEYPYQTGGPDAATFSRFPVVAERGFHCSRARTSPRSSSSAWTAGGYV